ncbi:MAG: class II glutamine amidotransferase [Deltaproteobacteria bacterium]|nr:class II glutamine amidotransferase [Deltaproteobacteria bacterium]
MCRFALYLGPDLPIASLITEPSNSIIHQSFHSAEREEPLNGDGFGLCWYVEGHERPALFKDVSPAWNNLNLHELARVTHTTALLAHVRAATAGLPVTQLNCHPFVDGPISFMHNGTLAGFARLRKRIIHEISEEAFARIQGSTDSEYLFAIFLDALGVERHAGKEGLDALSAALEQTVATAERLRRAIGEETPSRLNLVACDGRVAVACRFVSDGNLPAHSLYVQQGERYGRVGAHVRMEAPGESHAALVLASEPLSDNTGWRAISPGHLVELEAGRPWRERPLAL